MAIWFGLMVMNLLSDPFFPTKPLNEQSRKYKMSSRLVPANDIGEKTAENQRLQRIIPISQRKEAIP